MVYKALLWTDVFWIAYINWYKLCGNNLSVVLGSKQEGVETRENQIRGMSVNSISDSLSLTCLVYFAKMPNYFLTKTNKIYND